MICPAMEKTIKVLLIITGVKSSQILGSSVDFDKKESSDLERELGINFIEK